MIRPNVLLPATLLFFGGSTATLGAVAASADDHHTFSKDVNGDDARHPTPRYVLTEEHHHVVPHMIQFIKDGYLQPGATLLHVDSHHDFSLPKQMPPNYRNELPKDEMDLVKYTQINDFLLALGYLGIVEHIIFAEPPWSVQCELLHNTTANISMVSHPTTNKMYLHIDHRSPNGQDLWHIFDYEQMKTRDELLEIANFDEGNIRTIRFTVVSYEDAMSTLPRLLKESSGDVILDVDLDGFGTFSPGSLALHDAIHSWDDLMSIYHTVRGLCDFDATYWENVVDDNASPECRTEWTAKPTIQNGEGHSELVSETLEKLLREIHQYLHLDDTQRDAIAGILAKHEDSIQGFSRGGLVEKSYAFFNQPFHVDESTIAPLVKFWRTVWSELFFFFRPKVVNLIRSPFYTPHHHLPSVECQVSKMAKDLFGEGGGVYHATEVDVDRVSCSNEHASNKIDVGKIGERFNHNLHEGDVHDLFYRHANDDKAPPEQGGSTTPEAERAIEIEFFNQHDQSLHLQTVIDDVDDPEDWLEVPPGETITVFSQSGTVWSILLDSEIIETFTIDVARGDRQHFSSTNGFVPIKGFTPVVMTVINPNENESHMELLFAEEQTGERQVLKLLKPGESEEIVTYHGHVLSLRGGKEANAEIERIVDAGEGKKQEFRGEHDQF